MKTVLIYLKDKKNIIEEYKQLKKAYMQDFSYFKVLKKKNTIAIIVDDGEYIVNKKLIRKGTLSTLTNGEPHISWEMKYSRKYKKYIYHYYNNKENLKQYLEEYTAEELYKLSKGNYYKGETNERNNEGNAFTCRTAQRVKK